MSQTAPAITEQRISVRLVMLTTFLWGGAHMGVGIYLLLSWAEWVPSEVGDLPDRIMSMSLDYDQNYEVWLPLSGVLAVVLGVLAVLAVVRLRSRQQCGRGLTLIVSLLAISLGLCFHVVVPPTSGFVGTAEISLAIAQILYGSLTLAVLTRNRDELTGIYIVRLMSFLVGLPVMLSFAMGLHEFTSKLFFPEGPREITSTFTGLAVLCGFVAGVFLLACGTCLLILRLQRFRTAVPLMIAAGVAEGALATSALLGATLGHSKGGFAEAFLLVLLLPIAIVLFLLTASGVRYLTRPHIRRALDVGRD